MTEQKNKEKEYLLEVSEYILPDENPFSIHIEGRKEIFVINSSNTDSLKGLDTISCYKTLFDTASDLSIKINFSLRRAIEETYSEEVLYGFDLMRAGGKKEWNAYFYIENALFRIESLWDTLAQIYNVKYSLEKNSKKIYHNRVFSDNDRWIKRYWSSGIPEEIKNIVDYFTEEDNTDIDVNEGMWRGNYSYVNLQRNNMTHNFSLSRNYFSSYAFELKSHPSFIIKRVAECFYVLQNFIIKALENIF